MCSRSEEATPTRTNLLTYLEDLGATTKVIIGASSIFEAYNTAFNSFNPDPNSIFIFCHDDIEILLPKKDLVSVFRNAFFNLGKTGFIGPAGTTLLHKDCVWWNHDIGKQGFHRGMVFHGKDINNCYVTYYGPYDEVVVLDGVFLAAKTSMLKTLKLNKPESFISNWDFYDIHMTMQAHLKGYHNRAAPIPILHNSKGEPREGWQQNRIAFYNMYKDKLPCSL